jgi:coatomer subunit beta'
MSQLATESYNNNQHNVSFLSSYLLGDLQQCLEILIENGRIPEATFFAHTYAPSQVPRLVSLWRDAASQSLSGISKRVRKK